MHGTLFAYQVNDPSRYGIVEFNNKYKVINIEEKPANPPSNLAIGGIYLFDKTFWQRFDEVSSEEDFSISDVSRQYVKQGLARIISIGDNSWLDCGTPENLKIAEKLVKQGIF